MFRHLFQAMGAVLVLSGLPYVAAAEDRGFHIDDVAEFFVLHRYKTLRPNKALAVGPGGVWRHSSGRPTVDDAKQWALGSCLERLRREFPKLSKQECVLFDVNGTRTGEAPPVGVDFGTVLKNPDKPLKAGRNWPAVGETKGIVLLLHGCDRVPRQLMDSHGWVQAWSGFYRSAGFRVVMPDSFADKRDPVSCGWADENTVDIQSRNRKLRIAQTQRTFDNLQSLYPGLPIFVHGHSEGASVAQALGKPVAGIIVTGSICGYGVWSKDSVKDIDAPPGTPLLTISGSLDNSGYILLIRGVKDEEGIRKYCEKITGIGNVDVVLLKDTGHYAGPWWPQVATAVSKFIGSPAPVLKYAKRTGSTKIPKEALKKYRTFKGHYAFATSKQGEWDWSNNREGALDAEHIALFGCDARLGWNAYLAANHTHKCYVIDVDGQGPPAGR